MPRPRIHLYLTPNGEWWYEDKSTGAQSDTGWKAPTKAERVARNMQWSFPQHEITVDVLSALDKRVK